MTAQGDEQLGLEVLHEAYPEMDLTEEQAREMASSQAVDTAEANG